MLLDLQLLRYTIIDFLLVPKKQKIQKQKKRKRRERARKERDMECLGLAVCMLGKRYPTGSRQGYRQLTEDRFERPVKVVAGKEKREFMVDPFVLEESPFQMLLETVKNGRSDDLDHNSSDSNHMKKKKKKKRVVVVDVDSLLFEHMLWLMHNDCSSLFQLNLKEIIDFYSEDY